MANKIVFILLGTNVQRANKRVAELIESGFDVEAYSFIRKDDSRVVERPYKINVLGTIKNGSYLSRIWLYIKSFRKLANKYKAEWDNTIFYLDGFATALFFHYVNPKCKYIFEEADMKHTNTRFSRILEKIDKRIIRNSLLSVFTSEGFLQYHFGGEVPENVCLVTNRLNKKILDLPNVENKSLDMEHLSFGFVGAPRYDSVYNFIDVFCRNYPQHTFHIFGGPITPQFEVLKKYDNCVFHGFFNNPDALPEIYSQIDIVLCTYDIKLENVRYAEPNKIYEAMYFDTPIIVSKGTFLAEKVARLGIGYDVDALDDSAICSFIDNLTADSIQQKTAACRSIEKADCINENRKLIEKLRKI